MLLAFSAENHLSIKDRQVLNLEATSDSHLESRNVLQSDGFRLLRSVAIYGANASGKSNLINALLKMKQLIVGAPPRSEDQSLSVDPFKLAKDAELRPSGFECVFLIDGFKYRYGFRATTTEVTEEWLFRKSPQAKEARLFTREKGAIDVNADQFQEGSERVQFTLKNALFLSLCAQLKGEVAGKVLNWFRKLRAVSGLADSRYFYFTAQRLQDPKERERLVKFAKQADLSICDLSSQLGDSKGLELPGEMPEEDKKRIMQEIIATSTEIKTKHRIYDSEGNEAGEAEFDLKKDESDGTRKFIALSGPLHHTIEEGAVLIVDEFEARLHPLLTQSILDWFHSPANPSNAQLVLTTHEVLLMEPDRIRRDQVWFCEKDQQGATSLSSLAEFDPQKVRSTTKFSRQYLLGLFGSVPQIAFSVGESADA